MADGRRATAGMQAQAGAPVLCAERGCATSSQRGNGVSEERTREQMKRNCLMRCVQENRYQKAVESRTIRSVPGSTTRLRRVKGAYGRRSSVAQITRGRREDGRSSGEKKKVRLFSNTPKTAKRAAGRELGQTRNGGKGGGGFLGKGRGGREGRKEIGSFGGANSGPESARPGQDRTSQGHTGGGNWGLARLGGAASGSGILGYGTCTGTC